MILRVDIRGFKVAVGNLPVPKPHWLLGGPTRPAAIASGSPGRATVRIALDEAAGVAPMGLLTGRLGTLSISGRCRLVAGEQEVAATIAGNSLRGFHRHVGDAVWSILPDGALVPLPLELPTPLEIFELLGRPSTFYSDAMGVWAEALRFLAERVGVTGISEPAAIVERIARFCHRDHGLRYDTQNGGSTFFPGVIEAIFKLSEYLLEGTPRLANCYDQAAALQALAGALGIDVRYRFLEPCGHIQIVDLLGVGPCNNPLFEDPDGAFSPEPIVEGTPRSFFDNHAFCQLEDRIFDACVGPHIGIHPPGAYIERLIDATVPQVHGVLGDIDPADGVVMVI
jgi:hypothetical protein